jgi:hypothetical protein
MVNLLQSIQSIEGDPLILPYSKIKIDDSYWVKKHPGIASGQIKKNTVFGKKIYDLSKDTQYKTYLDIGTWCGLGTTKCLLDGIIQRKDAKLYAIESNYYFYKTTHNYWTKYFDYYNISKNKFKLYYGSLILFDDLDDNYITDNNDTKYTYDYNKDIKLAPTIKINDRIDVLCLDGGHFSTIHEWNMFKDNIKVIILDDTNTSKSRNIFNEIIKSPSWKVIYNSLEGTGELIATKISN